MVAELQSRGYLDDEAFARWWAQSRSAGRRIGSLRLRRELAAKGIAPELTAPAVDAAFEESSELERALETGRRRLPALQRAASDRVTARLVGYLLRRGYPPHVVRLVVKRLIGAELGDTGEDREGV